MGCFNMFCAISGAVIRYKDPIVAIGLKPSFAPAGFDIRDDDIWTDKAYSAPALPLFGQYDDYGGIDLDSFQYPGAESLFRENIPLMNRPHVDEPEKAEIHNNNFRLMFIHRSVYDRMNSLQRPYVQFRSGMRPLNWTAYDAMITRMKDKWELFGYDEKFGPLEPGIVLTMVSTEFFEFCQMQDYRVPRNLVIEMISGEDPKYSRFVHWYHSIVWLQQMSMSVGFRIAPSLYAGQDAEITDREWVDEEIAKLREAEKERFDED